METWAIYKYTVETFVSKPVRSPSCEVWFYLPKTSRLVVALHFLLERNNRLRKRRWKITLIFELRKLDKRSQIYLSFRLNSCVQCLKGKRMFWAKDWRDQLDFSRQDRRLDRHLDRRQSGVCLRQFRVSNSFPLWQSKVKFTIHFTKL